ncbi:MAG: NAD(P)/FAD-dependent oxidoreductase [Flavobacterium sp.]|nr:NAD(P)/FAD-dependent oxidoreductase [Flavobacterium sp.]
MEIKSKIVIVGAGLAGLTAAIHLSKLGYTIIIIEKNSFPKHKVCGEYVSNEVIPYLQWLGIDVESLNPSNIDNLHFSTRNGKSIKAKLPMGGFGLSRYAFDLLLYQKALENKCEILQETVDSIDFKDDKFSVYLTNNTIITADFVLGAFGKRSNLDQKLGRNFIQKKSPWLAVKGHYKANFPSDLVGLHHFDGGYCGISKVENDVVNICYLASYSTFKKYEGIVDYESSVLSKNPFLKEILEKVTPIFDKPLTISQISFDKKKPIEQHILMIGDSAGLIHPLCGNGMAMAINSAKIASNLLDDYFQNTILSRKELEAQYTQKWNQNFKNRLQTGRILGGILQHSKLSEMLLQVLIAFPFLLPLIIRNTHGKQILPTKS